MIILNSFLCMILGLNLLHVYGTDRSILSSAAIYTYVYKARNVIKHIRICVYHQWIDNSENINK